MIRFINYPPTPNYEIGTPRIDDGPLKLEYHDLCYASPRIHRPDHSYEGCLYSSNGHRSDLSMRPSISSAFKPADPPTLPPTSRDGAARSPSRSSLYLGSYFFHFGHFLLDTLSRAWLPIDLLQNVEYIYFHPWAQTATKVEWKVADYLLPAVGIDWGKVRFVSPKGEFIENCLVPESSFKINHRANQAFSTILDRISARAEMDRDVATRDDRIYLTRRHQKRRAGNEEAIEDIFRRYGFKIVVPEQLSLADQIATLRDAEMIAGCDGSAMHLAGFARKAVVISLDQRAVVNQFILEELKGHEAYHIWCLAEQVDPRIWLADLTIIESELRRIPQLR